MKWTSLEAYNFLSFEEMKLSLDNRGLILIEGENKTNSKFKSNGSGKSSLLEPLVYALYDTTSKGIKADEVVNNKVGKNAAVILTGTKGADTYRIERYRKHSKEKNKVKLFLNDKEISEKSATDTNKAIEKLIGIDFNTFVNSIMFSQGSGAGRFAIATDKEKKEILENLINLEVYARSQEIAKSRIKEVDVKITEKEREGERLNWELSQVDTLEEQDKSNYENTKNLIKQEDQNLKETIDALAAFTQKYSATAINLREEIVQLEEKKSSFLNIDISSYFDKVNQAKKKVTDCETKQSRLNYEKADLVKQYQKLQTATNCPVCGRELDSTHREQEMDLIKEKLRGILVEIQQLQAEMEPLAAQYEEVNAEYLSAKELYDKSNQEYYDIVAVIQNKQQQVQNYELQLRSYKDKQENASATIKKLRSIPEPRSRNQERKDIKDKIKAHKGELLALQKEKKALEDVTKVYSNSGVKSHVLDLVTPFLNERANKYLTILSGSDMEIKFSTQTRNKDGSMADKFDVQVINHAGGETYKSNSEGEKKRIDLSISLAIQDFVMNRGESATNLVVYDEVFDALDSVGSENVVTLLKERLKVVSTILVITHSEHLKPLFEKVITVTKNKNGISTITEGAETT